VLFGCSFEVGLLVIASIIGWLAHRPCWSTMHWRLADAVLGLFAAIPLLGLFLWMTVSKLRALAKIRQIMERAVRPFFAHWTLWQLALISALAGVGEEALFRGAIQDSLSGTIGRFLALAFASLLFGALHLITSAYAAIVVLIGLYLGGLWLLSGNLLAPIVTHAVYDFLALVYFLRIHQPKQ
jgi:membrane protease YdiL (CAAX protease family)